MDILDIHILRGPNYWSIKQKVVQMKLSIERYEDLPTDKIPGFYEKIQRLLPGLYEHHCSEGKPGGFFERVRSGTWMGHVIEHIALQIQNDAGMDCCFGRTRSAGEKGIYNVVFSYKVERAGTYAAYAAVRIAEALCEGRIYDIQADRENLKRIAYEDGLGPSTSAIIRAAEARNIPCFRLDNGSFVQLGYGSALKRIDATITDGTSNIAVDLASDKHKTKNILRSASLPVPEGYIITERSQLAEIVQKVGFPLVIKPNNGNQGKGVVLNVNRWENAIDAFDRARKISNEIIIEKYISGNDYRLLIIDYKLTAAAHRSPAQVTGNGFNTIKQLIDQVNLEPGRGNDHENILTRIVIDKTTEDFLRSQALNFDSIPANGHRIFLKQTANLSTGGTAEDVTDIVHPSVISMAERTARVIGLDICGIDFITSDISKPWNHLNSAIIEVNAAPGFRMHTNPYIGKPRPVGEAVTDMLFRGKNNGRIPVVAVTGTNGKTTVVRLIAHMAKTAGFNPGFTTTTGIYIGSDLIEEGDCTGPVSARKVLSDSSVNFAILECARGGILRAGLGFDQCETGIVTNVAEDHLGLNGITTIDEMARVKAVVPESVMPGGTAILNENNEYAFEMRKGLKCSVALFSINPESQRIWEHINNGGIAAIYSNRKIILFRGRTVILKESVENIPSAFGGKAFFMVENILAAILGAYTNGIDIHSIVKALHSFNPSFENNPGRMNLIRYKSFDVLLDYAHNFHSISALGSFVKDYESSYKIGIITAVGDRRDIDIINVGKAAAGIFDKIILRIDEDTRGRKDSEISDLLMSGIREVNTLLPVDLIKREADALRFVFMNSITDSLVVLLSDDVKKSFQSLEEYMHHQEELTYTVMSVRR